MGVETHESVLDVLTSEEEEGHEMDLQVKVARGCGSGHGRGRGKQSNEKGDNVPTPSETSKNAVPQTRSRSGRLVKPNKKYDT